MPLVVLMLNKLVDSVMGLCYDGFYFATQLTTRSLALSPKPPQKGVDFTE